MEFCRYCLSDEKQSELYKPCLCKGSLAYVHNDCLKTWINRRSRYKNNYCEICDSEFKEYVDIKEKIFIFFIFLLLFIILAIFYLVGKNFIDNNGCVFPFTYIYPLLGEKLSCDKENELSKDCPIIFIPLLYIICGWLVINHICCIIGFLFSLFILFFMIIFGCAQLCLYKFFYRAD